ncbi:unnamed protein product [Caenorhabditis auriculariae]|uniref:Uncharacterized protein n=1 Tax=Caenorhabditis auriculariae TaxID=2777116 RepID=A0A8S1H2M2_9PELO|nr:unnamed protein product [Caenorhabditis auriculariae]
MQMWASESGPERPWPRSRIITGQPSRKGSISAMGLRKAGTVLLPTTSLVPDVLRATFTTSLLKPQFLPPFTHRPKSGKTLRHAMLFWVKRQANRPGWRATRILSTFQGQIAYELVLTAIPYDPRLEVTLKRLGVIYAK